MEGKHPFFVANALVWSVLVFLFVIAKSMLRIQPDWPWWIYLWGGAISFFLFFEIMARLGPEKFETPIGLLLKESVRDRVAISGAVFAFLVILSFFPAFIDLRLPAIYMVFFMGILVAPSYLILYFGGSEKLRNSIVPKQVKEAGMRDRIVILFGYLTELIIYAILISSLNSIWVVFVCCFLIVYIPSLLNFTFGSQKLRDEVTPKWLKEAMQKRQNPKGEK
jgi:hypothetical protein